MENEPEFVSVNTTPTVWIVKSVYHFTMMLHGVEPHRKMCMNANVSQFLIFLIFCSFVLTPKIMGFFSLNLIFIQYTEKTVTFSKQLRVRI